MHIELKDIPEFQSLKAIIRKRAMCNNVVFIHLWTTIIF